MHIIAAHPVNTDEVGIARACASSMQFDKTQVHPLVLIVEDDQWIQAIAGELLEDEGFATASAPNGELGLRMAEELRPALILLDLGLPAMSGNEFLRRVDRHDVIGGTPVIIVTGRTELPEETTKLATGVLRKPFDLSDLLVRVHRSTFSSLRQNDAACPGPESVPYRDR